MATLASASARPAPALAWPRSAVLTPLLLTLAAFLLRWPHFGDPAYQIDEQFYLLVGDRMLHGALPYVDIWDRKPIGLFMIYAAIRLLGGDGIWQYQIVATLFAAATAWIIHRITAPRAGLFGSVAAGLLYLVWIETVEGGGGQAPIFYNPLMAGAAWCLFGAGEATDDARFRRLAFATMALSGLAIQIKYTALFESFYFGLVLAWWAVRREPNLRLSLRLVIALAAVALAPTLLAIGFYAATGHLRDFWFANFVSIALRGSSPPHELHQRLIVDGSHCVLLGGCCLASIWQLRGDRRPEARRWVWLVTGWIVAAVIGFGSVGMYYGHYLLPLYVPLAVGAAPIFRRLPIGPVMAGVALWVPIKGIDYPDFAATAHSQRNMAALEALLPGGLDTGCMHILEGPPILYHLTHACLLTRYVFPEHLIGRIEAHAIGTDPAAELARVLRARPRALITNDDTPDPNPASFRVLRAAQARFYRHAGRVVIDRRPIDVWVLR